MTTSSERTIRNRLSHAADLIGAACMRRAQRRKAIEEAKDEVRLQEAIRGTVFAEQPNSTREQK